MTGLAQWQQPQAAWQLSTAQTSPSSVPHAEEHLNGLLEWRLSRCTELTTHLYPAEEHLTGLAEWQQPQAGMFAWLKLCGGIRDADQILDKLKEEKVVVVPGQHM